MTVEPVLANEGTNPGKRSEERAKGCPLMRLRQILELKHGDLGSCSAQICGQEDDIGARGLLAERD